MMPGIAQTAPLTVLDELYLHLNRDDEPWSVHLEIRAEGHIDRERLETAVRRAARAHPLARARLGRARPTDVRYQWEIAEDLVQVDLLEVDCADDDDLARHRERLLSRAPALDRPGPFALLLAHRPGGDSLVLNLHHAAGDGLSALRLMGSIARAYGGVEDPPAPVDALAARDLSAVTGTESLRQRIERGRAALGYLSRGASVPARIAPQGETDQPGYGFEMTGLEPGEMQRLAELRTGGATVNDALLAALAVTIRRWNERREVSDGGAVYLMMPINLRPSQWRFDIVGNFASYVSVRIGRRDQRSVAAAIKAAAASTRHIKDGALGGLIVELFTAPTLLPTGVKQRLEKLIPLTANLVVDTAVLSNLGRITDAPRLGDAGAIREVWFSPPGRMPLGASLGVATLEDRLFITLRYRHALFDASGAAEFLQDFRRTLVAS